ncbi:MAG: exosome complex protein Rrp42 [Candidatus Aenigmarchaeota archaeon]|nr:exosome complex protein Rrp42 [Candidatus Aenigmarchaeota archaeon]
MIPMSEEYVLKLLRQNKRMDGRNLLDYREIKIETGVIPKAEGSALVQLGNTKVLVGIKMEIATPFPDMPDEGILIVNAEFAPIANPEFEPGPPGEEATETARLVDRLIRESKMIDTSKLVIQEGEKVWGVFVDIHILNDEGNLLDASAIGAVAALYNTKIPKYENDEVIRGEYAGNLPVRYKPVMITMAKIGDKYILDPNYLEEEVASTKLSVGIRDDDVICAVQKRGSGTIKFSELEGLIDLAIQKSKEIRSLL